MDHICHGPILQSAGCDLIDRTTWKSEGTLDSDACFDALNMMQKWIKNGWVVPQSSGTNQFYAEGNPAAPALGGHWVYAEASAAMKDNVIVLPLPKFGAKAASPNGTWIWAVTTTSKHPGNTKATGRLRSSPRCVREHFSDQQLLPPSQV